MGGREGGSSEVTRGGIADVHKSFLNLVTLSSAAERNGGGMDGMDGMNVGQVGNRR